MTDKSLGHRMTADWLPVWRERLIGCLLLLVAVSLVLGLVSHLVPGDNQAIGALVRIADGIRPALLLLSALLGLGLALAGLRWIGGICTVLALAGLAAIAIDYRARTSPPWAETDLTVVWLNLLNENAVTTAEIEAAIRASDADIIALSETIPAAEAITLVSDLYPHRQGCARQTGCAIVILSRLPFADQRNWHLPSGPNRLVRIVVDHPTAGQVPLLFAHLTKPWYQAISDREEDIVRMALNWSYEGRLIMMGDFNAAPWSRRIRGMEIRRGLMHPSRPTGTWPARLGPLGVPIDHAFVRGDARITTIEPWGEELGSNHRGLIVGIDLDAP